MYQILLYVNMQGDYDQQDWISKLHRFARHLFFTGQAAPFHPKISF